MILRAVIYGAIFWAVFFVVVGALQPSKAETWLSVTTVSKHFSERKYNEKNYGLGLEFHNDAERYYVGFYENSYNRTTVYAMAGWHPLRYGNWRLGVIGGLATGYERPLLAAGTLSYEAKSWGLNVVGNPAAVALQIKWRFQ